MTRLRQQDREAILYTLTERGMKKSYDALKALKLSAAMEAYNRLYNADTQTRMEHLPNGWLPTHSSARLSYEKKGIVSGATLSVPFPSKMRFLDEHVDRWNSPELEIEKSSYEALDAAIDANAKKRETLRTKITGVLASVNTWKKLYEVWPAARNVLVKLEPASADNLPAIIPQDLNDELELP